MGLGKEFEGEDLCDAQQMGAGESEPAAGVLMQSWR